MKTLTHIELLPLARHCNPGKFEFYQLDKNKQTNPGMVQLRLQPVRSSDTSISPHVQYMLYCVRDK